MTAKVIDLSEERAKRRPPPPDEKRAQQVVAVTLHQARVALHNVQRANPKALAFVVRIGLEPDGNVSVRAEAFDYVPDEAFARLYVATHGEATYRWIHA